LQTKNYSQRIQKFKKINSAEFDFIRVWLCLTKRDLRDNLSQHVTIVCNKRLISDLITNHGLGACLFTMCWLNTPQAVMLRVYSCRCFWRFIRPESRNLEIKRAFDRKIEGRFLSGQILEGRSAPLFIASWSTVLVQLVDALKY